MRVSKTHQQAALDAAKRVLSYGTNIETVDILAVATNGCIDRGSRGIRRRRWQRTAHGAATAPGGGSRAAAAVLLNKLVLTSSDSASALVTAAARLAGSLDLAAALPLGDEAPVAAASAPAAVALAALIDCCAAPLARVADAVAALSCEAARGDAAAAFDVPASGDGLSSKDEADVAADIKVLVFGSKLVGAAAGGAPAAATFAKVPALNGIFRQAVRALHALVRIELNAPVKLGKRDAGETGEGKEEALVVLATQLARAVQALCKLSVARARLCAESIADAELRVKLTGGVSVDDLKGMLDKVLIDSDAVSVLKGVYNHLLKFRDFLAWEAAVAMVVIGADSSIEKPQAAAENEAASSTEKPQAGGDKAKGDKKSKKKKTLGKGTSAGLMLLRDHVTNGSTVASVNSVLVAEWATSLSSLFDPKCLGLESLVEKVKEIVESNEVRRLPKIPKVRIILFADSAVLFVWSD
ncbi:histidine--tRNA ligase, cytoplasmic-like [Miscanthus floridulus]|uniref:histidine--tRNA ligase, cytoplasmic-like n=1 Tax=Miscanthus floridulus TaxID=154761 RepID=UPI0034595812